MNPLQFAKTALPILNKSGKNYGVNWVKLKIKFHNRYQKTLIFSTRFGADFFNEVIYRIENKKPIVPEKDSNGKLEKLGDDYDLNFNKWLAEQIKQDNKRETIKLPEAFQVL